MLKRRAASFVGLLLLNASLSGDSMAAEGLRLIGVVHSRMVIETRVGRDNSLLVRNGGNQAEALEIRIEGGQGRSPALSRIWRVSAGQLASSYVLPVAVAPGSRVVLSAP